MTYKILKAIDKIGLEHLSSDSTVFQILILGIIKIQWLTGKLEACLESISVWIVLVSFESKIFVFVWLVAILVEVVVVDVEVVVRGFGFCVVVVLFVDCTLVLFSPFFGIADGVVSWVVVDVVEVVVVVVVEVVDVVVVVGYETFVSKKLVTWSSTSTNSHDLKINTDLNSLCYLGLRTKKLTFWKNYDFLTFWKNYVNSHA